MICGSMIGRAPRAVAGVLATLAGTGPAPRCSAPDAVKLGLDAGDVATTGGTTTCPCRSGVHDRRLHRTATPAGIASPTTP
jgi:hypothetical protein